MAGCNVKLLGTTFIIFYGSTIPSAHAFSSMNQDKPKPSPQSTQPIPQTTFVTLPAPPFQLQKLDHIVLRCHNFDRMFHFYNQILGCTIDNPQTDVGRFNGVLTHLRAGETYIDLLAYDVTSKEGQEALLRMHGGGKGISSSHETKGNGNISELFSSELTNLDHVCLRIDPFEEDQLRNYFEELGVEILASGDRKGAEGVGPSIYIQDPEANVIELKGPSGGALSKSMSSRTESQIDSIDKFSTSNPDSLSNRVEESTVNASTKPTTDAVSNTPCNRICRYNADFYNGQVCIGCFRESYEIGTWSSMTPIERSIALYDAVDRCYELSGNKFEGSISKDDLLAQAKYWGGRNST